MTPRMLPNGSITDAVVKPESRVVSGSYSVAPIASSCSKVAGRSSTCQNITAPPGVADGPPEAYLRSMKPSSSWSSPTRNSTYAGGAGGSGKA